MKNKHIYELWAKFTYNYKYYLNNNYITRWLYKLNKVKNYINNHGKKPSTTSKQKNTRLLGRWVLSQQYNCVKKINNMSKNIIYNKWIHFTNEYKQYFLNIDTRWMNKLKQVQEYINKNNKKPSSSSSNEEIKALGHWISVQKINYKKKIGLMKNKHIYETWTTFVSKYYKYFFLTDKIRWIETLTQVRRYIDKFGKKPHQTSKNKHTKHLYGWIWTQQTNYKKRIGIMKNKKIYEIWTNFIDKDYKKYFLSSDEKWNYNLEQVKTYINKYKIRPSTNSKQTEIRKLGLWISNQQTCYKTKKGIMKKILIYNRWAKFTNNEYKKYFKK